MATFEVTRDSVCMGDDVDAPHYAALSFEATLPLKELVILIVDSYQLASVASPLIHWICKINNIHVATVKVTDGIYRKINFEENVLIEFSSINQVYFKYTW